jgi:hypothetical protein
VLRPVSVRVTGAATAVPSGTLAAVTSDNSDSTYIQFALASSGSNWNLRVEPHTPAAGFQRHQVRGRIRIKCDAGTLTEDIDLGRGTTDAIRADTVPVSSVFAEQFTSWYQDSSYGLATVGALSDLNIGGGWLAAASGGATSSQTAECYVDIDCRSWPVFSPEIRDNAGVNRNGGTVTDTTQPTLFIGAVNYDDLPALNWLVEVHTVSTSGPVVFSSSGSGTPPASVTVAPGLPDAVYYVVWTVRSTIRSADPFEREISYSFTLQNVVPPPSPPLVTVSPEFGGYRVEWTNPGGQAWQNNYVVAEVYRDDCTGSQRIATIPNGLNGSYLDLAIPQVDLQPEGVDCESFGLPCDITYRVRYVGYVSATTVQLPNTIPAELILGWPGTAASIPSGWSRVTDLDGYYPRGATTTAAPSVTGGAATHTHTTPNHTHVIGSHSHPLGGNTSTTSSTISSPRFNGGTFAQSESPHYHPRPAATGVAPAQPTSASAPGTSPANNLPQSREVIWIKSDGTQSAYPVGVLGFSIENVSAWTDDTASGSRFLRGAAAGANGGAALGSNTHIHSVLAHTHNGFSHDHGIGSTGLSLPTSATEMGAGVGPQALPRHNHPMDVINASTGNLISNTGGNTNSQTLEPPYRALRTLRNTGGGIQTRIMGLYLGTIAALNPVLTWCNGANGTADMRTFFPRTVGTIDFTTVSVNATGGSATHVHGVPNHGHDLNGHIHTTTVGLSTTGTNGVGSPAPTGPSPRVDHTHTSGNTAISDPGVSQSGSGATGSSSHVPVYKEVHFVRLDGTVVNDPLAIPELKTSAFASITVPSFVYGDDLDRLSSFTDKMAVTTDRSHDYPRLVIDSVPLEGGFHTIATTLAGEDMQLTIAVEGLPAINRLETLLSNDRVYWSPVGGDPGWYAPNGWSVSDPAPNVKVVQVKMVRQPWPATPEPGVYL